MISNLRLIQATSSPIPFAPRTETDALTSGGPPIETAKEPVAAPMLMAQRLSKDILGQAVMPEAQLMLEIAAAGRYGGSNRFMGQIEIAGTDLQFRQTTATQAA